MTIFILRNAEMPWGDYGEILLAGMTSHLPRKNGLLQLERTGPFVPPITCSGIGNIVVTEKFKSQLEQTSLTGLKFQPVIKTRIVHLEWEIWDKTAEHPAEYPENGEPENYILAKPHSSRLAKQIGDLWEVQLTEHADVERVQVGPNSWEVKIYLLLSSWDGTDWFRAKSVARSYISKNAKQWLEQEASKWVSFQPALTKE